MTVEMIESPPKVLEKVLEVNPLEPKAVFMVKNGIGGEREMTVTLSSWQSTICSALDELKKIKEGQVRVRERGRMISKIISGGRTPGSGRPYSSIEKKQIRLQIVKDEEKINLAMEINRRRRTVLIKQGNWLLVSPQEFPLKVRVKNAGDDDLVAGEPLNSKEAAWRMYVLQEGKDFTSHPNVRIVKEFFVLRRDVFFKNEDKPGEAAEKLDEFRRKISSGVPDELVTVFKKINEFDFKKPLLSELETLKKEV